MAPEVVSLTGGAASGRAQPDAAPPAASPPMGGAASGRALPDAARQDAAPPVARRDAAPPIAAHPIAPSITAPLRTAQFLSQEKVIERTRHHLPHWKQDGTTCFVTFRLADSLPQEKLWQLRDERNVWMAAHPEFVRWRESARIDTTMGGAASGRAHPPAARQDAAPPVAPSPMGGAASGRAPNAARQDAAPPTPYPL